MAAPVHAGVASCDPVETIDSSTLPPVTTLPLTSEMPTMTGLVRSAALSNDATDMPIAASESGIVSSVPAPVSVAPVSAVSASAVSESELQAPSSVAPAPASAAPRSWRRVIPI